MVHERYAPMYWLNRWSIAEANLEHEAAAGYAHLALLLTQLVCSTWSPTASTLPEYYLENALLACRATYKVDGVNLGENEHILYFEGLKLIACRSLLCSLMQVGCYDDCQAIIGFLNTPSNWRIKLSEDELERLNLIGTYFISGHAEQVKKKYYSLKYMRLGEKRLWANPYDIDTSTVYGLQRLNGYLINRVVSVVDHTEIEGYTTCFVLGKDGKPSLVSENDYEKGEIIIREQTHLSVAHNDGDKEAACCAWCLVTLRIAADDEQPERWCCQWAKDNFHCKNCLIKAKHYMHHRCLKKGKEMDEEEAFKRAQDGRSMKEFGHSNLLLQRLVQICQTLRKKGKAMHPLQYDAVPYLASDCKRIIPWGYKTGIVEPIEVLIREGVNPFTDDDWDIKTIVVLWRKLGPVDFHTIGNGYEDKSTYDGSPLAGHSGVFLATSLIPHSCDPNAAIEISPESPYLATLRAIKPIGKFQPITVSRIYYDVDAGPDTYEVRQAAWEAFGIQQPCKCPYCLVEVGKIAENRVKKGKSKRDAEKAFEDHRPQSEIDEERGEALQKHLKENFGIDWKKPKGGWDEGEEEEEEEKEEGGKEGDGGGDGSKAVNGKKVKLTETEVKKILRWKWTDPTKAKATTKNGTKKGRS